MIQALPGVYERDILPKFRRRLLTEITPDDIRALCAKVNHAASTSS